MNPKEDIRSIGQGHTGDEAVAIAIYCALKYGNKFKDNRENSRAALCAAVNHDGDSDSTGAITGNILGAHLGSGGIPSEWIEKVQHTAVISRAAAGLLGRHRDVKECEIGYEDR